MVQEELQASVQPAKKRPSRLFGIKIIKLGFQLRFSGLLIAFFGIGGLVMWLQGYWASQQLINSGLLVEPQAIENLKLMNSIVAKSGWLAGAVIFAALLMYSHLIAGPVYRFEKTLEELKNGNLTARVNLRAWDEFKEVADEFTEALGSLRLKVKKDRDAVEKVLVDLDQLAKKVRADGQAENAAAVEKLISDIKTISYQIHI